MKPRMLAQLMRPLSRGRRVRRKPWRDIGKYLMSPHDGLRNVTDANLASCYQYFIGSDESVLWMDTATMKEITQEVIARDWEVMPEPDHEAFGKAMFEMICCYGDQGLSAPDMYELLGEHGLAHHVRYNPKLHVHGAFDADEGDMFWYLGG